MAKVTFKNLPMGVALEPSHFYDNVNEVLTEMNSVRIQNVQRKDDRAVFTMTWNTHRGSSLSSFFAIPPLQEYWIVDSTGAPILESDSTTPIPRLERLVFSFDVANGNTGMSEGVAAAPPLSDAARPFTRDAKVIIKKGDQVVAESMMLQAQLTASNDIVGQRPNPIALADLGIELDPYAVYTVSVQAPLTVSPLPGVDSMVVQAIISHELIERDTSAILDTYVSGVGNVAQNAPLHDLARSAATHSITPAVAGQNINADGASGVQTTIETVDDIFRNRLRGGLTPLSKVTSDEVLKEDQAYFCDVVPLFKASDGLHMEHPAPLSITGYLVAQSGDQVLFDRAIIPILSPMTIHHVLLSISGVVVGTQALVDREIEVGVGIVSGVRTETANYNQVAYRKFSMDSTTGLVGKAVGTSSSNFLWGVPVVYSTVPGNLGRGFLTQGRPYYVGRERATAAGTLRRSVAVANPANPELPPAVNGAEQYLEVRVVMRALTGGSATDWPIGGTDEYTVCSQSGVNVYIAGKRALGV